MLQDDAVRSAGIYLDYLLTHREEGAGLSVPKRGACRNIGLALDNPIELSDNQYEPVSDMEITLV